MFGWATLDKTHKQTNTNTRPPGRTYHFTGEPIPLEGARAMAAAGARMHTHKQTQHTYIAGRTYHFTEDPIPLEGARIMAAAGARMHKFRLSPLIPPDVEAKMAKAGLLPSLLAGVGRRLAQAGGRPKKRYVGSLLEAATHPDLGYDKIFDSPEINRWALTTQWRSFGRLLDLL